MYLSAYQARGLETCKACKHCVDNYDRWYYLFCAVVETLRNEFKRRKNSAASQVLRSTLETVGVSRGILMGIERGDIFALHPSQQILADLEKRIEEPANIIVKPGRPPRRTDYIVYIEVFKHVHEYVKKEKNKTGRSGWINVAQVICNNWPTLLGKITRFPGMVRQEVPPIKAVRSWMNDFDAETQNVDPKTGKIKGRLQTKCLAYRLFTFLCHHPEHTPRGEEIGEYVLRNEKAMRQTLARAYGGRRL